MNRLKLLRVTADLTQDELAKLLDVSRRTINLWENDKGEPSASQIRRMCLLYDCTSDYLLGIEQEQGSDKKR